MTADRRIGLGICAAASAWALLYLWHGGYLYRAGAWEETAIGAHLARGHGFVSPFDPAATAPATSWSPPVYPALIAAVFRATGVESATSIAILKVVNALCYGAVAAGLYELGRRLFGAPAGLCATALFVAHPLFLRWVNFVWDMYVALALFVGLIVAAFSMSRRQSGLVRAGALGGGLGVLMLTNASYVFTAPLLVLLATARHRGRARLWRCAAAAIGFTAVLAPWTVRNVVTFGYPYFVRGGVNFELWYGNRPEATGWLNSESFGQHPGSNAHERRLILDLGEPRYFAECGERFRDAVRRDPGAFVRRCAHRVGYLFVSDPTGRSYYPLMPDLRWRGYVVDRVLINSLLTIGGLAGAWAAWRLRFGATCVIGPALLSALPFVPSSVWDRQTLPLRALLVVMTGFLIAAVAHRLARGAWPAPVESTTPARPHAP